jgi:hypothetical protein
MMSRPGPAFRILVIATVAATLYLDATLARARAAGQLPAKLGSDCIAAVAPPVPSPPTPPPAASGTPPFAAFGSCGDTAATPAIRR